MGRAWFFLGLGVLGAFAALAVDACSTSPNDNSDSGSSDAGNDIADDVSVEGDAASSDAIAPGTDAGLTNWFPGHYIQLASASISTTEQTELTTVLAQHVGPFVGVQIQYDWWKYEGTKGDYSAGDTALESDLEAVAAAKKKLIIFLQYKNFTATGGAVPDYMLDAGPWCIDAGNCGQCDLGNGEMAVIWQGQDAGGTADRLHAWIAHVGAYVMGGAHASTVAGVVFAETAGGCTSDPGYTADVYLGGLEADVLAAGAAFPGVPIFQYINFMPDAANESAELGKYASWAMLRPFAGIGCPDVAPVPYPPPGRPNGCTTQAFTNPPPGYAVLLDASVQGTIPFNVAVEREDMLLCATPDLISTYDMAIKQGPAGMAAQYVVWDDYNDIPTNAFGIDQVGAFIVEAGAFPNAKPTW